MLEGRVDLAGERGGSDVAQTGGDGAEGGGWADFGALRGGEVDAGVDGQGGGPLLVDVGDPGGGGVYPGLAFEGGVDVGDQGVDHIKIQDAGEGS